MIPDVNRMTPNVYKYSRPQNKNLETFRNQFLEALCSVRRIHFGTSILYADNIETMLK